MTNSIVHGFEVHEAFRLLSFLFCYETKLKKVKSTDAFETFFKNSRELRDLVKSLNCYITSKDVIWGIGAMDQTDTVYMTSGNRCLVMAFLCHLRNSIAHGQIEKVGDVIQISDYNYNKKAMVYSAKGSVKSEILWEIITTVNKCL